MEKCESEEEEANEIHRHGFCKIFTWQESAISPTKLRTAKLRSGKDYGKKALDDINRLGKEPVKPVSNRFLTVKAMDMSSSRRLRGRRREAA